MSLTFPAMADVFPGIKGVKEVPSGEPGVFKFEISEEQGGLAAMYTEVELEELYSRLLNEYGPLKTIVKKIYDENGCKLDGKYRDDDAGDLFCGELSSAYKNNTVLWSHGRGGWASAYATYKSFLTWTSAGTGHFTDAALEITTDVSVEARELGEGPAKFDVIIDMSKFREIEMDTIHPIHPVQP
jgi:hypothetical protein